MPEDKAVTRTGSGLPKTVKLTFFIIVLVFCICGYIHTWRYFHSFVPTADFCNYYIAAFAAKELPRHNIYEVQDASTVCVILYKKALASNQKLLARLVLTWIFGLSVVPTTCHFNATPFLYTVLSIFKFDNYLMSLWMYGLFSFICYVLAIWWLCRRIGYSVFSTSILLLILTSWFAPFRFSILALNVDLLQLGALALFLYLLSGALAGAATFASGILLGLTLAFKPNIVFSVLMLCTFWLVNRRFKTFTLTSLGMAGGALLAFLLSSTFFGSIRIWLDWHRQLNIFVNDVLHFSDNYAIARMVWGSYGIKISPYLATFLLCAACGVVWMCRGPVTHPSSTGGGHAENTNAHFNENLLMISIGLLIYLLSGPVVWGHYFICTIPAMLIIFRPLECLRPLNNYALTVPRILVVLTFVGISIQSVVAVPEDIAMLANSCVIILFLLALWELWRLKKKSLKGVAVSPLS